MAIKISGTTVIDDSRNLVNIDAATVSSINGGPLAGFRNAIINGGMQVAQRAAPTITDTFQYGQADRFLASISGGTGITGNIAQSADSQFRSGSRLWLSSLNYTGGIWAIQHRIEAANSIPLGGNTVTVSFRVWHDFGSSRSIIVSLAQANALDNFSGVTDIGGGGFTSSAVASGVYTNVSCSFTLAAGSTANGILLQIRDSSSTTVTSKNVVIGDVQLEVGPVATPFERRPIGTELALCQRYFCKSYNQENAPGAITSDGAVSMVSHATSSFMGFGRTSYPVQMRVTPILTPLNPVTGSSVNPARNSTINTNLPLALPSQGSTGFSAYVGDANVNQSQEVQFHYTASAEL